MPYFLDLVKKLENKSNEERKNIIIKILKNKKIKYKLEDYSYFGTKGVNIIVEFGKGNKYSIASAHYDVVLGSPGANDDASAISVLFKLIENLRKIKLKNKIKIIFFGDEEIGRFGSLSYIKKHSLRDLIGVYHMELVGMGDSIGLWPVTKFNENSYIIENIEKVLEKENIYWEIIGNLPAFYGDDLSFREHRFKHAICISVTYKKDKEKIKRFVKSSIPSLIFKYHLGLVPKMFKLYHSKNDKSIYLNENAMGMTADVLTESLINLDKKF
ncbi:MAG: M20/M25/M40 family metallo-hydrolase [Nanoarchaeota archaeon]|nr:M20/M25/M40 family metallo-hydrolase [Nanoarchaeota archaeon]